MAEITQMHHAVVYISDAMLNKTKDAKPNPNARDE